MGSPRVVWVCAWALALSSVAMAVPGNASAEVLDATDTGFTVRTRVEIGAPATQVYDALTTRVDAWWDGAHSYSGQASNLSIDARPGGCFCETLPGGGVQHMVVVYAERGKMLRLSGGLGPLQPMPGSAVWTIALTEAAGRTTLEGTFGAFVYSKEDLKALAPVVDRVTGTQLARLKVYVEAK